MGKKKEIELDELQRYMINEVLGTLGWIDPLRMRLAYQILDEVDMPLSLVEKCRNDPIGLHFRENIEEHSFTDEQSKFLVDVTLNHQKWSGFFLREWIPIWNALYPEWEELQREIEEPELPGPQPREVTNEEDKEE